MKFAPCRSTIRRQEATKASALFAALYKEDMLDKTKASVEEVRASKSEVPAITPKSNKTRKDARRCRAGPLLVRLFWHDRAGSSILPALSEHLGVEDVEV